MLILFFLWVSKEGEKSNNIQNQANQIRYFRVKHIAEKYLGKVNNDNDPNGASLAAVQETFKKFMSSSIKPSNSDSSGVVKHERKITAEMLGPMWKEVDNF